MKKNVAALVMVLVMTNSLYPAGGCPGLTLEPFAL
jgi:hypothetical protein